MAFTESPSQQSRLLPHSGLDPHVAQAQIEAADYRTSLNTHNRTATEVIGPFLSSADIASIAGTVRRLPIIGRSVDTTQNVVDGFVGAASLAVGAATVLRILMDDR